MSKFVYKCIRETLQEMLKIEFDSSIKDMEKTFFFIDDEHCKLIVKNYDSDIEIVDYIDVYFKVLDYEYIQYFQIGYTFNKYELIEFDLDDWWS